MSDTIQIICNILKAGNIENFRQEARWIMEDAGNPETAVNIAQQRAAGAPLQYLLGTAPFRNLMLKVDPRVLIPRPETELLAQWLIDHAPYSGDILDLGCGSGAIAIAAATERNDLHVTAADISPDALTLARENAALCGANNICFIQSNLFSSLTERKFDLIGANLPYVTEEEFQTLPPEVKNFEPVLALTAPDNGLALILKTIAALAGHLKPGGGAIFELSPHQAATAANAVEDAGFNAGIIRDFCNRERFVTATRQ
ncbi:MAG: peptide chain release factor N(5)-glutamine methyltransferase [Lentisphaeria bacterium]|nr:peptide chain release factor N(5)-glutamine methyltransferase [Lentisphaeria bacterium]